MSAVGQGVPGPKAAQGADDVPVRAVGSGGPHAPGHSRGRPVGAGAGRSDDALGQAGLEGRAAGRQIADPRACSRVDGALRGGLDGESAPSASLAGEEARREDLFRGEIVVFGVNAGTESHGEDDPLAVGKIAMPIPLNGLIEGIYLQIAPGPESSRIFSKAKSQKMRSRWPNLFIVGAPKSGTTSLYHWLKEHPDVFMSNVKEPMYMCGYEEAFDGPDADILNDMITWTKEEYLSLFEDAGDVSYLGEASTEYLSSPKAPDRIRRRSPNAKIIIALRNPVDRAFSEHMHLVRDGLETESFRDALKKEQERREKNWNPLYHHCRRSRYSEQIKRYKSNFKENNIKIMLFDEIKNNTKSVYKDLLNFLGLTHQPVSLSAQHNPSGHVRIRWLFEAVRAAAQQPVTNWMIKRLIGERCARKMHTLAQNKLLKKGKVKPKDKKMVIDRVRKDMEELKKLIDKNISEWKYDW